MTHNIARLIREIESNSRLGVPEKIRQAVDLTAYAVSTRYPGDTEDPVTVEEYRQAVGLAREVFQWVSEQLRDE